MKSGVRERSRRSGRPAVSSVDRRRLIIAIYYNPLVFVLRIISADSGAAILSDNFQPETIVASSSVLVEPPYRLASASLSKPIFSPADSQKLVLLELRLCRDLLSEQPATTIHIDMSLGGISLADLTLSELQQMSISSRAKENIRSILPDLRRVASEIERGFGVEVLAVGKDSMPVRIAELTAGANALIYVSRKVLSERKTVLLGLPSHCTVSLSEHDVSLRSLQIAEHDVFGYAKDEESVMESVILNEFNNPLLRGFRVVRVTAK